MHLCYKVIIDIASAGHMKKLDFKFVFQYYTFHYFMIKNFQVLIFIIFSLQAQM